MKSGKSVLLAVAGVTFLLAYSLSRRSQESGSRAANAGAVASPAAEAVVIRKQAAQLPQVSAAAEHHRAIRESASQMNANIKATMELSEAERESAAVELNRRSAELEKRMLDSMTSLTQQMVRDPSFAASAIAMLQAETDPETMMLLAQAIGKAAPELGDKFPHDLLAKMAETDPSIERRTAALIALGYMTSIPPSLERRIAEVSRTSPSVDVRVAAVSCMGSWMSQNRELTQRISESLLATREVTDEPSVRGLVIQSIGNMEAPLSGKVLEAMSDAVVNELEAGNRSLAALALGSGVSPENRDQVLATLEQAYNQESQLETKRHIITQITKASRYDAETYLKRLPTPDPQLAQDIEDYVQILSSMDRNNWGAIWERKSEIDHQRGTYPGGHGGHADEGH